MTEEEKAVLTAWNARRFDPPYPLVSRFLTAEEYAFVMELRRAAREMARQRAAEEQEQT